MNEKPKIFISYSHEDENSTVTDDIWNLAVKLRNSGIEAIVDQDFGEDGTHPDIGWMKWMENNIEISDYIIILCTEMYYAKTRDKVEVTAGRGVKREWLLIDTEVYDNGKYGKYIPITYKSNNNQYIPNILKNNCSSYQIDDDENINELIKILTKQNKRLPPVNQFGKSDSQKTDQDIQKLFQDIEKQKDEKEFVELVSTYIELIPSFGDKTYFEKIKYIYSIHVGHSSKFICILKELEQTEIIKSAINELKEEYGDPNCKKIEVKFDTLTIDISPKDDDYIVSFYGQNSFSFKEQSYSKFSDTLSNKGSIVEQLSQKINKLILGKNKKPELAGIKTMAFILPNELLNLDLKKLKGKRDHIVDYDIIIKLGDRLNDDTCKDRWEENWSLYEKNKDKIINEISFLFKENDSINEIDKNKRETYPLMIMNCQMSPEISDTISENGISIVLYQEEGFEYKKFFLNKTLDSLFENKTLKYLPINVNDHIRDNIKKNDKKAHISLIWDNPNTVPQNIKIEERDSL